MLRLAVAVPLEPLITLLARYLLPLALHVPLVLIVYLVALRVVPAQRVLVALLVLRHASVVLVITQLVQGAL